jgi:peroxiredoxin
MKDLKSILLIVISGSMMYVSFYFLNKITEMKQTQKTVSDFAANVQLREEFYKINFEHNCKMTGNSAPDIICRKNKEEELHLSALMKKRPLLIYRYANITCQPCFENELEELRGVFAYFPEAVVILTSYRIKKGVYIFETQNNMNIPIYYMDDDSFNWAVEDLDKPYFFILHTDMKISNIYVPNKDFPEFDKQYLESVKRFLSE